MTNIDQSQVGVQDGQARKDMLEACRESRHAGKMVEKLAENLAVQVIKHEKESATIGSVKHC